MFNKVELFVGGVSVVAIAAALFLVQNQFTQQGVADENQQVAQVVDSGIEVIQTTELRPRSVEEVALAEATKNMGNISRMVIDDIKVGTGTEVKEGDTVLVHYAGTLQDGTEFDNSRNRGEAFEFTVGAGMVIKGWEEGLIGMKEGGERVLVIPPEKGYGERGIGPIPGGATLVFKIELLEVK